MPRTCNLLQKFLSILSISSKLSSHSPAITVEESTNQETAITKLQSGKVEHLACVCRSKSKPPMGKVPYPQHCSITCPTNMLFEDTDDYSMYNHTGPPVKLLVVSVKLKSVDLEMELNTRASIPVISEATYNRLWPKGKVPAIQDRLFYKTV